MSEDRLSRQLEAGEVLFLQGQSGRAAFVIQSGAIEIYCGPEEAQRRIAILGVNDIFGEMALLGDTLRTASARAVVPTLLLVVTPEHLNERLLAADPMTRHLLRTVVSRCRQMLAQIHPGASANSAVDSARIAHEPAAGAFDRERAFGRLKIEQELELALERKEFQLYFQPVVRLSDRTVAGYESLIRWFKPGVGMVPPGDFIPIAEASSLINRIGLWVIESAFDSLLAMDAAASHQREPLFLNVNLSARQLDDPELLPALAEQMKKLQGRDCCIQLELTESLMIGNVDEVRQFIASCREMGLQMVLDDFGTGYCSLSYLHQFDVHTMKLDRSFVLGMAKSAASEKVVLGVTRMAHDLGLKVVVEGVERLEEADQAARLGIDYVQGYYYGRPAPLADALKQLRA